MRRPYNVRFISILKNESPPSHRPFSMVRPSAPLTAPQAQEVEAEQRDAGAGRKDPELAVPERVEGSKGGVKVPVISGCVSMFRHAQHEEGP